MSELDRMTVQDYEKRHDPDETIRILRAEATALRARVAALEGAIRQARADLNSVNAVDPADELGAIQNDLDAALATAAGAGEKPEGAT